MPRIVSSPIQPPVDPDTIEFLVAFAARLHAYGAAAQTLESSIVAIAARSGLEANVLSTPTSITLAVGSAASQQLRLVRVEPGGVDLGRLAAISELARRYTEGEISADRAVAELVAIRSRPPEWPLAVFLVAHAIASAAAAVFFGGGVPEIVTSAIFGLVIGIASQVSGRSQRLTRILEPLSAILAALGAAFVASFVHPLAVSVVAVSGLIALLPGFTLTLAMSELATRNLVSGTARLASAAMTFMQLGFGVALGTALSGVLAWDQDITPASPPGMLAVLASVALGSLSFAAIFHVPARHLFAVVFVGACGFAGSRWGAQSLGPELGAFVGALVVGLAGNLYARVRHVPAAIVAVPGLLMLVPGSVGFRSVAALISDDVLGGIHAATGMFLIAAALVAGLLAANVFLRPRAEVDQAL